MGTSIPSWTTPSSVTFNNGGSGAGSGSTYDGNSALTVSYNTVGAASSNHTHAYSALTSRPHIYEHVYWVRSKTYTAYAQIRLLVDTTSRATTIEKLLEYIGAGDIPVTGAIMDNLGNMYILYRTYNNLGRLGLDGSRLLNSQISSYTKNLTNDDVDMGMIGTPKQLL